MKQVLILSYHALPMDVIASYRAQAYLNYLYENNFFPTLVTHDWKTSKDVMGNISWQRTSDYQYHEEINQVSRTYRITLPHEKKLSSKFSILWSWIRGYLDNDLIESYQYFKRFLFDHLKIHKYDLVIAIFSPHYHLRLAYEIHATFGIPYIVDMRDTWNNEAVHVKYTPGLAGNLQNLFIRFWWKRWMRNCNQFFITSAEWVDFIHKTIDQRVKGNVVTNGFEEETVDLAKTESCKTHFVISHAGSLYSHQEMKAFFDALELLSHHIDLSTLKVRFIGALNKKDRRKSIASRISIQTEWSAHIQRLGCIELTERMSKKNALLQLAKSHILLLPTFPNSPGTYSGKIFDYLGLQKTILCFPDDHGVVNRIINETSSGVVLSEAKLIGDFIFNKYQEWKKNKSIAFTGNLSTIAQYSRRNQVRLMADILKEMFG